MTLIADISNWDDSTFNAQCFKDAGVVAVILGCQDPTVAERQGNALLGVGIPIIATYGFDYFGIPGVPGDIIDAMRLAKKYKVTEARSKLGYVGIADVYIDAEVDAFAGVDIIERNAEVEVSMEAIQSEGLIAGLYTGSWFWIPKLGNSTQFSHLSLWHSEYPTDEHKISTVNYGGWTKVAIHQYTSNGNFCGRVERDLNYIIDSSGETDMGMTVEEKADFDLQKQYIDQIQQGLWGVTDQIMTAYPKYNAFELCEKLDAIEKSGSGNLELPSGTYRIEKVLE